METEALLLVSKLLKDGKIEKIKFGKKYFKVKFKVLTKYVPYEYTKEDIMIFFKDQEELAK